MLSSFPICLEWLPIDPSTFGAAECDRANLGIVGSFLSDIEVWDLDVLDSVEPKLILVGANSEVGLPSNPDGHRGPVISLALNKIQNQILASGSADGTVKLWDLSNGKVGKTHNCGEHKPENIMWHPSESSILFVATDNNTIQAADIRAPKEIGKYTFEASIESLFFDPQNENELHMCFGNGYIGALDITKDFKPSYGMKVNKKSCTSVSMSKGVPGLLAVTGMDSRVYVYDTRNRNENNCPALVDRLLTQGVRLSPIQKYSKF